MQSVLGLLRFGAAVLIFCMIILPEIDLPGSMMMGSGVAWADDDGGDDDDDGDGMPTSNSPGTNSPGTNSPGTNSPGTNSPGTNSPGTSSPGTSSPGVGTTGATSGVSAPPHLGLPNLRSGIQGSTNESERWSEAEGADQHGDIWNALNKDDDLAVLRSGSWNRRIRTHAVRGELLALDIGPAEIQNLEQAGFQLVEQTTLVSLGLVTSRFSIPAGRDIAAALRSARAHAPGATFEPNYIYQPAGHSTANTCQDSGCYGPTLIGWESVSESCGTGIRIGMTDTAIDRNHPALRGRSLRTRTFDPHGDGSAPDHGTAVAGLLVGNAGNGFPGMLPGAELFAADVFHTNESGDSYSTLLSLVQGLDWLVDSGVSVVNVSMTGPPNALLENTVKRLNENGVIVVAAAGNGGPTAPPAFPAAYEEVVSVTAVDQELRPYSMANRGAYISFSSPGVRIWSAGVSGSGQHRTGTSFAAAHASAIIADVIRQGGPAGARDAIRALQSDAQDLGVPGKDPVFGWGLIHGTPACQI